MALRKLGEVLLTRRLKLEESNEKSLILAEGWLILTADEEMVRRILEPMAPRVRLPEPAIKPWVSAWKRRVR